MSELSAYALHHPLAGSVCDRDKLLSEGTLLPLLRIFGVKQLEPHMALV